MNTEPLIIERILNAPIAKVWKAITNKEDMKKWYFDLKEFKAEEGFEFQFYGGKEEKQYLHLCKIVKVIENKVLSYSWRYPGYSGISFVTFELFAEGDKTKLRLTHEGLDSFPDTNPDLAKENFLEGWKAIIGTFLKDYVEN